MVRFELQSPNKMQKTQRSPRSMDWAQSFDTNTIKTLRVNSDKLDKLVNQIGNLIVARIKSHENIGIAKTIQDELLELQKHYHKIGYYMKFYEKKYVQEYPEDQKKGKFQKKDAFLGYNKQLLSFHNANAERMTHILNHLNILTKEMQENNIKLNTTTSEIENMVKSMRILPLSTVFNLFPRMVHNIAHDKGKEIELIIEGQEVSADKKIIEDIKIPIMHIVRNSIDHGIELPKERERLGKNKTGVIIIKASRRENKIVISIKDDGHGINIEKIKAKAIEKGLITREAAFNMSKEQLANFIFYPGFSTGDTVTELSGRGFGLDIVHTKISQLNGRIDVYSEENKETIVTMELPTTMATMKAFIIKEDDRLFALAAANIQTVLRITPDEIKKRNEKYYFIYDNQAIPVCSLASILNIKRENKPVDKYTMMIIKAESVTLGIIVQKLIGDEEILNKKLPEPMLHVKNISGIATLANGEMCLLLNIGDILNSGKIVSKDFNTTKTLTLQDNSKYKILVVDDSVTTRRLLTNVLSSKGYNVETESSAMSALDNLELNNYDLIISDYEMPDVNGLEFLKIIHSKEKTKNIPVFVLTSVDKSGLKEEFLNNGACEFIKKEYFDQKDFIKLIDKYLNISLKEK
ncbi:MAG: response regulator [Candidatus Gastranaerophilales bacterium]|nr:response regulator [Candidatus Gastranaerophilales bacterium]